MTKRDVTVYIVQIPDFYSFWGKLGAKYKPILGQVYLVIDVAAVIK